MPGIASLPLVIRVAVTGHRPPKLTPAHVPGIRASVRKVLDEVIAIGARIATDNNAFYEPAVPVLHVISSLAEGADRIVAEEGQELQAILQYPLPAPIDSYCDDFATAESKKVFSDLSGASRHVFQLDGHRTGHNPSLDPEAYAAASYTALTHCDLLLAVWDGKRGDEGGTGQTVRKALAAGIPVIRIHVDEPGLIEFAPENGDWRGVWLTDWEARLHTAL